MKEVICQKLEELLSGKENSIPRSAIFKDLVEYYNQNGLPKTEPLLASMNQTEK